MKTLVIVALLTVCASAQTVIGSWEGVNGTFSGTTPTYKDHPDPSGDNSPNYVVHATGQTIQMYARTDLTTPIQTISTPQFFRNAGATINAITHEPKVMWIVPISRWIITTCDNGGGGNYVAVSAAENPTSLNTTKWKVTTITGSGINDDFLQPGWDYNGLYVTSYAGASPSIHQRVTVWPLSSLQWVGAGSIGAGITPTGGTSGGSNINFETFPMVDRNASKASTDPFVMVYRIPNTQGASGSMSLAFYEITWSGGTPTISTETDVVSGFNHAANVVGNQPAGGGIKGTESHRGSGYISPDGTTAWIMLNSGPCSSGCIGGQPVTTHNGFFWFKVRISDLTIRDSGFKFDTTKDYLFAGSVVDSSGNVSLLTTCSDATSTFAGICEFHHLTTDSAGVMTGPNILYPGAVTFPGGCAATTPPGWGLWVYGSQDVTDGSKLWAFGEYAEFTTACQWATRIVKYALISGAPGTSSISIGLRTGTTIIH